MDPIAGTLGKAFGAARGTGQALAMTLSDLSLISDESRRGIREAHAAGWQRIRDSRYTTLAEKIPRVVAEYGEVAVRDAVGLVVAAEMLAASAELVDEIARERGVSEMARRRGVAALLET